MVETKKSVVTSKQQKIKNDSVITLVSISMFLIMAISCNNATDSKEHEDNESKVTLHLEKEKKELQKSIADFRKALAVRDAKTTASYYTVDPVFMSNNAPVITGRDTIKNDLAGFIVGGFTKLNVETTWMEHSGEYLLDTEKWTLSNGEATLIGKSLMVWKMYKDMIHTDTP